MNRSEFVAMAKDVKEHPERLAEYRKIYKNVYPFSDGIFKMLIYLIEIEKFFAIEDRTPPEERELSDKAEMLPNILYEKQGSYLQGQEDMVKAMLAEGVSVDIVMRVSKFSEKKSSSCWPRSLGKNNRLRANR